MSQHVQINRIPLTILTGFLGSGKTTLLNHILHGEHGMRIAVLVNDFGAVNIDAQLVVGIEGEDTVNLANGCICCTIRDDLFAATQQICQRPLPPEYILIETSGVSDPLAVAHTFTETVLSQLVHVESILTVVDAEQYDDIPAENRVLALDQIGMADIVVLNKVDLVSTQQRQAIEKRIRQIVPTARILPTTYGHIPLALLFGHTAVALRPSVRTPHDVHVHAAPATAVLTDAHAHAHDDHTVLFHTWHYQEQRPFHFKSLQKAVNSLPLSVFRAKGVLYLNEAPDRRCILQVVGKRARLIVSDGWGEQPPHSDIVLIGSGDSFSADALHALFEACLLENQPSQSAIKSAISWVRDAWQLANNR